MEAKKKDRKKHVSFATQREQCRLNKFTYDEKCSCGIVTLMCNYPFPQPDHRKGICKASTCTDMRTLPDEIVEADKEEAGEKKGGGIVLPEDTKAPGEGESTQSGDQTPKE